MNRRARKTARLPFTTLGCETVNEGKRNSKRNRLPLAHRGETRGFSKRGFSAAVNETTPFRLLSFTGFGAEGAL